MNYHGCGWETFYIFAYCGLVGQVKLDGFVGLGGFEAWVRNTESGENGGSGLILMVVVGKHFTFLLIVV